MSTMKIINRSGHPLEYKTPGSAGLDLHAKIGTEYGVYLRPGSSALIQTGITLELPPGSVGLILPRSGLTTKHRVLATTGVIDEDYRGELAVNLINLGSDPYTVRNGDRIAQLVILPILRPEIEDACHVSELSSTERGGSGFGSTGR